MLRSRILVGAGLLTIAASASACGTSSTTTTPSPSPSPTTVTRTATDLTAALLVASDLPAGYYSKPIDHSSDPTASSSDPNCSDLVTLINAKHAPGALASAEVDLEPGDHGPNSVDENLDALGTSANVAALLQRVATDAKSCAQVNFTDPASKQSLVVKLAPATAPTAGTGTVALSLNIAGFSGVQVFTGVGDTVLSIGVPASMDVNGIVTKAVQKAQTSLAVK